MVRWRLFGLLLALFAFTVAGCFREASDTESSVVSQPVETAAVETPLATIPPLAMGTPTLVPVTIISPPTQSFGQPLQTPTPPLVPTNPLAAASPAAPTATTGGFITPIVPLGQVTLILPSATATGGNLTTTPSGLITPTALVGSSECTYVVAAGDNLFRIATNNGVSLEEMRAANPELVGEAPILQPGQVLQIPGCVPSGGAATPQPANIVTTPAVAPAAGTTAYTVQRGDTLFSIATRFGITTQDIISANNLANPDRLDVGQQLVIPAAP